MHYCGYSFSGAYRWRRAGPCVGVRREILADARVRGDVQGDETGYIGVCGGWSLFFPLWGIVVLLEVSRCG